MFQLITPEHGEAQALCVTARRGASCLANGHSSNGHAGGGVPTDGNPEAVGSDFLAQLEAELAGGVYGAGAPAQHSVATMQL